MLESLIDKEVAIKLFKLLKYNEGLIMEYEHELFFHHGENVRMYLLVDPIILQGLGYDMIPYQLNFDAISPCFRSMFERIEDLKPLEESFGITTMIQKHSYPLILMKALGIDEDLDDYLHGVHPHLTHCKAKFFMITNGNEWRIYSDFNTWYALDKQLILRFNNKTVTMRDCEILSIFHSSNIFGRFQKVLEVAQKKIIDNIVKAEYDQIENVIIGAIQNHFSNKHLSVDEAREYLDIFVTKHNSH